MECINATGLRRNSGQWGTQPLLLMQGVGVKAALSLTTSNFLCTGNKTWVPHSSRTLA
jgi:hypothetical protein